MGVPQLSGPPVLHPDLRLPPHRGDWTLEDLQQIDDDGHRFEIVEGDLLVMNPPTTRHDVLAARLVQALNAVLPAWAHAYPPLGLQMGRTVRVPDVVVVRGDPLATGALALRPEQVLLVVEVQSASTSATDRFLKAHEYARAGVPGYWRLDPDEGPTIVVEELEGGAYRHVGTWAGEEEMVVERPAPLRLRPVDLLSPRPRGQA